MPLFEFRCNDCDDEFEELLRSAAQSEEVECPACHSRDVQRLQSGFATVGGSTTGASGASSCSGHGGFS